MILKVTGNSLQIVESKFTKIIDSNMRQDEKLKQLKQLFLAIGESHVETQFIMKKKIGNLAIQNAELKDQNKALEEQIEQLQNRLKIVTEELQKRKERELLLQNKKEKWENRKRLPKKEAITTEIYTSLIKSSQKFKYNNLYKSARLRLALVLLLVTGIRISKLRRLRMNQVKSLFTKHWINVNQAKQGAANHKVFLSEEGVRIIEERRPDFELMQLFKDDDSYIFTAENSKKPLTREAFTNLINKFLKDCALKMERNPNISSHSFRIGFITQLWKNTNDIELVRQVIGDVEIDITSQEVENISEKKKQ